MPRLIALDVDGTLVDESNRISTAVREAVDAVQAAGISVILATGRSFAAAVGIIEELGLGPAEHVLSNGAVTASYPPLEFVDVLTFDPRPAVEAVLSVLPSVRIAVEVVGRGRFVNEPFPDGELFGPVHVLPIEEMISQPVSRVIIRDPGSTVNEFMALAGGLGLDGVSYHVGYTAWLDLAPHGVDKAHGLARVAARRGIARRDVLAVGDGRNDTAMLAWAGRGVAMGGSPDEVLAAADAVTGSLAENGLATELMRWV